MLNKFYRQILKEKLTELFPFWQNKIGVTLESWHVKKMKTKWGSCNIQAKKVCINLELAKKPPECLEYIVVHELVHLLERHHNERFIKCMDQFLPNWREIRNLLNSTPLEV